MKRCRALGSSSLPRPLPRYRFRLVKTPDGISAKKTAVRWSSVSLRQFCDVRYWHKADIPVNATCALSRRHLGRR